jgi:hypothetical protein
LSITRVACSTRSPTTATAISPTKPTPASPSAFTDPSGLDAYSALNSADQFLAGFADTVTFGGSTALRSHLYGETATRNHSGGYFTAGQVTGAGATIAVGFGAPARLWQGANWAQRTAQIYTAGSTGFASYNSTRKIMDGCATPLDFLAFAPAVGYATRGLRGVAGVADDLGRAGAGLIDDLGRMIAGGNLNLPRSVGAAANVATRSRIRDNPYAL